MDCYVYWKDFIEVDDMLVMVVCVCLLIVLFLDGVYVFFGELLIEGVVWFGVGVIMVVEVFSDGGEIWV